MARTKQSWGRRDKCDEFLFLKNSNDGLKYTKDCMRVLLNNQPPNREDERENVSEESEQNKNGYSQIYG